MDNIPANIRTTLTAQVIRPLVEALVGLREVATLDELVTPAVTIWLSGTARPGRTAKVVSVKGQRTTGAAAIEAAVVVNIDGRYHGLALRVEVHQGRPVVTAAEFG